MKNKFIVFLGLINIAVFIAILLIPYVTNQFWYDDGISTQVWAEVHRFKMTLFSFSWFVVKNTLLYSGRMLFSYFPQWAMFYVLRDVLSIRLFSMLLMLLNIALFALILHKLKASKEFIAMFVVILFALFHITPYYDPIAATAGFYPSLGIILSASLLLLLQWRETYQTKYLWFSSWLIFISLICYEINIIYFVIALVVVWTYNDLKAKRIKNSLVILLPLVVYLTLNMIVRSLPTEVYSGTSFGSMSVFFTTYLKQIYATFPGSYLWTVINVDGFFALCNYILASPLAWLLLFVSMFSLSIILYRSRTTKLSWINRDVYKLGLALLCLPPVLIAASSRYQGEIVWGIGYLSIYYQYFGLALLISGLIIWLVKYNSWCMLVLIPLFGIYVGLNWSMNVMVSHSIDARYWSVPSLKAQEMQQDLFAAVSDGDVIEINSASCAVNGNLIYELTGKRIVVPNDKCTNITSSPFLIPRANAKHFKLQANNANGQVQWYLTEER